MCVKCTNAVDQLPGSGSLYPQKNHVDIIRDYTTSEHVRSTVDLVAKHSTTPTFIPVLDSVVFNTELDIESDKIHITSFIVCLLCRFCFLRQPSGTNIQSTHAIQLLIRDIYRQKGLPRRVPRTSDSS